MDDSKETPETNDDASPRASPAEDVTSWWSTEITRVAPGVIELRGYAIQDLIAHSDLPSVVWLLLLGEKPTPAQARLLEAALIASVDHGPDAPSIAAARMAATCGIGINNAVATGVNLLGDIHGGAGQQFMSMLAEIRTRELRGEPPDKALQAVLAEHLSRDKYIPGFGHPLHPIDPRRAPLFEMLDQAVSEHSIDGCYLRIVRALESSVARHNARVPLNVDGCTGTVYLELGFPPVLGRGLFVLSRAIGILAHAWEEWNSGRRVKGPLPPDAW